MNITLPGFTFIALPDDATYRMKGTIEGAGHTAEGNGADRPVGLEGVGHRPRPLRSDGVAWDAAERGK